MMIVILCACMFIMGLVFVIAGLRKKDAGNRFVGVLFITVASVMFIVASIRDSNEYNEKMARVKALEAQIQTKKGSLKDEETVLRHMTVESMQDITAYVAQCYEITEMRKELEQSILQHDELVANLQSEKKYTNVAKFLDRGWKDLKPVNPMPVEE